MWKAYSISPTGKLRVQKSQDMTDKYDKENFLCKDGHLLENYGNKDNILCWN